MNQVKNNLTLNEINNKIYLFSVKNIVIRLLSFIGSIANHLIQKKFKYKTNNQYRSFFFGYHDKKPFNFNDKKIIVHSYKNTKVLKKQSKKKVSINLLNLQNNKLTYIDDTKAWSWQIGACIQWYPNKNILYYNKNLKNKFITVQFDLERKIKKILNFSIYNISPDGQKFVIADFLNIGKYRKGYGFFSKFHKKNTHKDKLQIYCVKTKQKKTLYTFQKEKKKSVIGSYINHLTFSPDNTKIAYFRTILQNNNQRQIFFYYYCFNKKKNFIIDISKTNLISHYCWKNKDEIMFTMQLNKKKYSYKIFNINSKKMKSLSSDLNKDGHPMFNPKFKDLFVSDTYPNLFGFQKLFIYSILKKKIIWKKYIYSPYKYRGIVRCDLHPRWSNDGKKILIDYVNSSNRNIGIFEII